MQHNLEWLEVLGRGMSGVCRKVRAKDGTIMVVKQIDLSFVTAGEHDNATREARLLSSLSHPNVIRFYDEFVDDEMLHIVMEYAPFGTLKQNLAKMTSLIPESSAVWIMLNIVNGLDYLHQRKIVHRDLKSENIFIGDNQVPKLGDFGVATRLNSAQPMAVSVVGTPLYLSPELCNGEPYNTKSDIWAVGVLLYEVCSKGRLPFAAGNQGAVIKKILMGEYPALSNMYGGCLHDLLAACLNKLPYNRPNAHEMYTRLDPIYQTIMQQHKQHDTAPDAPRQPDGQSASPAAVSSNVMPAGCHKTEGGEKVGLGLGGGGAGGHALEGAQDAAAQALADHFTLSSSLHKIHQNRPRKEELWWEWQNKGVVTGQFRTLYEYAGTPIHHPHKRPPHARRSIAAPEGRGVEFKPRLGILPFTKGNRPTSAPSTPSTSGSPAVRELPPADAVRQHDVLDFLVTTPAILEGPLQGPMWRC